jgi:hypothetical protein
MSDWNHDDLARWLETEQREAWEDADALFARVAKAHLRPAEVPAGLTARIMAGLPARARASGLVLSVLSSWWGRLAISACLLTLGVGFASSSPSAVVESGAHAAVSLASLAAAVVSVGSAMLHLAHATLTLLGSLGNTAAAVATTGVILALLAANLFLASAAFFGLKRLLAPQQEYS